MPQDSFKLNLPEISVFAHNAHQATNHMYDGRPYSVHLKQVADYALKYSHLLQPHHVDIAIAGAWCHDLIEDARLTYNDVRKACGDHVAEVVYALTNEKGRTREERANAKYYDGIRNNTVAHFVKICDRLANVKHSLESGGRFGMYKRYQKEHKKFKDELYCHGYMEMFEELDRLLK